MFPLPAREGVRGWALRLEYKTNVLLTNNDINLCAHSLCAPRPRPAWAWAGRHHRARRASQQTRHLGGRHRTCYSTEVTSNLAPVLPLRRPSTMRLPSLKFLKTFQVAAARLSFKAAA